MISSVRWFLLAFLVTLSGALGEPVVLTFPPREGEFTAENPAYLFFKEIRATRMGNKKVSFEITLQGDIPHNIKQWVSYRIYFDVADFEVEDPLLKMEGFQEDLYVCVTQRTAESNFTVSTRDLMGYRSKLWQSSVTSLRARKDKISFNVQSDLFAEPKTQIRMFIRSLVWRNKDYLRIDKSPIADLPTQ
jgi:hypothetical protein